MLRELPFSESDRLPCCKKTCGAFLSNHIAEAVFSYFRTSRFFFIPQISADSAALLREKSPGQKNIDRVQLMYYHESDEHFFNIIRTKSFQMLIKPLRRYVQVIGIFRRI
ncbi:MAG: hypothetical protein BWK80_49600 [Desulfobacteraceae bacterium IS3]|nr:MAG: hypothetical protein BWK80_49600 [Desulfobacteraceae bacterium IS3]